MRAGTRKPNGPQSGSSGGSPIFILDTFGFPTPSKVRGRSTKRAPCSSRGYSWRGASTPFAGSLGEIELHAGNLEGAVYWWAQSVHSRERLQPVDVEVEAYLYLSVVAGAISGLHDIASALEGKVDAARGGGIRLNPGASSDLRSLVYESPPKPQRDAIGEVLRGLSEHYLRDEMDARREREERLNRETRDFYLREHQRKKEHKKRPRPGATAPGI
jgi:hypothetical protein